MDLSAANDRGVRAGFIADLLNDTEQRGVLRLSGAIIQGRLDLSHTDASIMLWCHDCDPTTTAADVQHACVRLLSGHPSRWPMHTRLDGLTYETVEDDLPALAWLRWITSSGNPYTSHTYEQLAAAYRRRGQERDVREVLLAKQRHRRNTLTPSGRAWSHVQDVAIGYGYQPAKAAAWLAGFLALGTIIFTVWQPQPVVRGEAPSFNAFAYSLDLLVPVVTLGQDTAWNPAGIFQWIAYLLIGVGWVLVTTVAAAVTRTLSNQ